MALLAREVIAEQLLQAVATGLGVEQIVCAKCSAQPERSPYDMG
jgi:hypothetical protein